jgi:hypothetical protein
MNEAVCYTSIAFGKNWDSYKNWSGQPGQRVVGGWTMAVLPGLAIASVAAVAGQQQ